MSINNSRDFLAYVAEEDDYIVTDHLLFGSNLQLAPGSYMWDWDNFVGDSVTFEGTAGRDTLFGGVGERFTFFMGTRGDDLYGVAVFPNGYVDYSGAERGVFVDMSYRGSRTFTDADGETRTVDIIGKARDGFGGTDYFAAMTGYWSGTSSVMGVFGSSHRDVMMGGVNEFYGGGGDDRMTGLLLHGGAGDDRLFGGVDVTRAPQLYGDEGDDWIFGADWGSRALVGGAGNDRIFAGAAGEYYLLGNEGNDFIDAGAGDDHMTGGVGADALFSGPGNDIIDPDVEFRFLDPLQPTDGARDVIHVTKDDLGDFGDVVSTRTFEEGRDQIRFRVVSDHDFRVYQEARSINPRTDQPFRPESDLADRMNTVLQVDQDGDGLGGATSDLDDYFLFVLDADLSLRSGFLLS